MLGAQLLLDIQYQAAFSSSFASLPAAWRNADGLALLLPAEGLLLLGLVGDAYVTVHLITGSEPIAATVAGAAMLAFALLLYGLPLMARNRGTSPPKSLQLR